MGLVGPEERILVTLFMQSAVNEGKAISVESLAKMINSEVDAVNRVVVTLANQGYVS
jgi:hypothetical protein